MVGVPERTPETDQKLLGEFPQSTPLRVI
jgi:hypothetical protein